MDHKATKSGGQPRKIEAISGRQTGTSSYSLDVHLTHGLRGFLGGDGRDAGANERRFVLHPIVTPTAINGIGPYQLPQLQALAFQHGLAVLGVDSIDDPNSALRTRMWYPLSATTQRIQAAADLWSNVSQNHDEHADPKDASLARYISFSLRAAGIRIRDASDQYHKQLRAAVSEKSKDGKRFSNIPMLDLALAIHAALSELGSARDYLSTWFARRLGAPSKVDSLAHLLRWLPKGPEKVLWPFGLNELCAAAEPTALDPWAYLLTSLRNLHIHRQPVGLVSNSHWMEYKLKPLDAQASLPTVTMPVTDDLPALAGQDYLAVVNSLFVKFEQCATLAARNCGVSCDMQTIVIPPQREG